MHIHHRQCINFRRVVGTSQRRCPPYDSTTTDIPPNKPQPRGRPAMYARHGISSARCLESTRRTCGDLSRCSREENAEQHAKRATHAFQRLGDCCAQRCGIRGKCCDTMADSLTWVGGWHAPSVNAHGISPTTLCHAMPCHAMPCLLYTSDAADE